MKLINVSTPKHPNAFTMVDDDDYEDLNSHKWHLSGPEGNLYVSRKSKAGEGRERTIMMHRQILRLLSGEVCDHRNGIRTDNRRVNLRRCTYAENAMNGCMQKNNTSGYKGVSWHKDNRRWSAHIQDKGKSVHLGSFFCLIKAARAYDEAAKERFGEFARLNFNQEEE